MGPQSLRTLGYALAAIFQAATAIYVSFLVGGWLDNHYPIGRSWKPLAAVVGILAAAHTFFLMIRRLLKEEP